MAPDRPVRRPFLVAYDYGTGGAWAYAWAQSEDQILRLFPELEIRSDPPGWMFGERLTGSADGVGTE